MSENGRDSTEGIDDVFYRISNAGYLFSVSAACVVGRGRLWIDCSVPTRRVVPCGVLDSAAIGQVRLCFVSTTRWIDSALYSSNGFVAVGVRVGAMMYSSVRLGSVRFSTVQFVLMVVGAEEQLEMLRPTVQWTRRLGPDLDNHRITNRRGV